MFQAPQKPSYCTTQFENVAYVNTRMYAKTSLDMDEITWCLDEAGIIMQQEMFKSARREIEALTAKGWQIVANYVSPSTNPCTKSFAILIDGGWRYLILQAPDA